MSRDNIARRSRAKLSTARGQQPLVLQRTFAAHTVFSYPACCGVMLPGSAALAQP